jgi:hypothetical protein
MQAVQRLGALSDLYYGYWGEFFHLALFEPGSDPADLMACASRR